MIEDAAHHLKKRRTSPSASPQRAVNSDDYSSDCCNFSFPPPPPSPPRLLLHTVRISSSSSSCSGNNNNNSLELGGGEEKKEDDYHHHHHAAVSSKKAAHRRSFSNISIVTALSALFIAPLLLWDDRPAKIEVLPFLRHIELIWVALLHISIWPVVVITAVISAAVASYFAGGRHNRWKRIHHHRHYSQTAVTSTTTTTCHRLLCQPRSSLHYKLPLLLSLLMAGLISTQTFLQMAFPSAIWNPAVWTPWSYRVYLPTDLQKDLKGGCFSIVQEGGDFFDDNGATFRSNEVADKSVSSSSSTSLLRSSSSSSTTTNNINSQPLCLSEQQWSHLSSGTLSSHNPTDVATVHRGLSYLQSQSKGIVINALARNIKNSIPDLRRNIEGLVPLLGRDTKLSFVVFENDSVDGTREELSRWAEEVNPAPTSNHGSSNNSNNNSNDDKSRYNVDLIQCPPPNTNCKLNVIDRNDVYGGKNKTSSGVGKLGDFRQTVLDHIVQNYGTYSHMIVLDVDLGVSVSPLGILHTLGLMSEKSGDSLAEEYVVASAATQVWPGTFGTVAPPYDLSAFRPKPTSANLKVRTLQRQFCEMMPPGDRWRNMCDAASPMQLFMILKNNDPMYHHGRPYEVKSAFNGITMYPLGLIRERGMGAKYDAGKDGQQCEHIGFHLSLRDTMVVNPKWKMNLKVNKPGGPNGLRVSLKVFDAMSKRPNVTRVVGAMNFISLFVFVWAVWVLSVTVRESIPSMIEFFKELRSRSETSFLYGYWLDVTGRGIESPSSSSSLAAAAVVQQQHRIVIEEEGKKYSS